MINGLPVTSSSEIHAEGSSLAISGRSLFDLGLCIMALNFVVLYFLPVPGTLLVEKYAVW